MCVKIAKSHLVVTIMQAKYQDVWPSKAPFSCMFLPVHLLCIITEYHNNPGFLFTALAKLKQEHFVGKRKHMALTSGNSIQAIILTSLNFHIPLKYPTQCPAYCTSGHTCFFSPYHCAGPHWALGGTQTCDYSQLSLIKPGVIEPY